MNTVARLLSLRLTSHPRAITLLGLLNILFLMLITHDFSIHGDLRATLTAMVIVPLLLSLAVIGTIALGDARERRTRHFTELPVSNRQVRLSFWGLVLCCLAFTTLTWALFVIRVVALTRLDICVFMIIFFLHAAVLAELAVLVLRFFNPAAQWQRQVYGAIVALAIFVITGPFYSAVMESGNINWSLLLGVLLIVSPALIALDIYLYEHSVDFLN